MTGTTIHFKGLEIPHGKPKLKNLRRKLSWQLAPVCVCFSPFVVVFVRPILRTKLEKHTAPVSKTATAISFFFRACLYYCYEFSRMHRHSFSCILLAIYTYVVLVHSYSRGCFVHRGITIRVLVYFLSKFPWLFAERTKLLGILKWKGERDAVFRCGGVC